MFARLAPKTAGRALAIGAATFTTTTFGLFEYRDKLIQDRESGLPYKQRIAAGFFDHGPQFVTDHMLPSTPGDVRSLGRNVMWDYMKNNRHNDITFGQAIQDAKAYVLKK